MGPNTQFKTWLIGFKLSILPFSIIAALLAIAIFQHLQLGKREISAFLYTVLFCMILIVNKLLPSPNSIVVTCNKKALTIHKTGKGLVLFDNGGLGEKINPTSWVQYTFLNILTKNFGSIHIKTIYTHQSKLPTLDALSTLCQEIPIRKIIFLQKQPIDKQTYKSHNYIKKILNENTIIQTKRHS